MIGAKNIAEKKKGVQGAKNIARVSRINERVNEQGLESF